MDKVAYYSDISSYFQLTLGLLGSDNDFTKLSLPDISPCEVRFSALGNLRLRAFSCLPRQNGSSNLGNFFTRTVFFKFLAALAVFYKIENL